jgi:uncharacterized protein (UPF0276 family)
LPLPFTEEALRHVVARVSAVQDRIGRQILIENVSSYLTFTHATMPEWEFVTAVARGADCGILLDVNNIYVSARNHGFDAGAYLDGVPVDRVGQIHLAGHSDRGTHLLDTHDAPVCDAVWELYRRAVVRFGRVSTLIEWDEQVPEFDTLCAEAVHRLGGRGVLCAICVSSGALLRQREGAGSADAAPADPGCWR